MKPFSIFLMENGSNNPKVQRYEAELRHAFADVSRFITILKSIAADRSFTKEDAFELAGVFNIPLRRLKSRTDALQEIEERLYNDHRSRQKMASIRQMAGE